MINQPPRVGYGDANGVNQAIQIIQDAAKKHGLPGVYIVGGRDDKAIYDHGCVVYNCRYDGQLTQEHFDAITKFGTLLSMPAPDGATPYSEMVNQEEQVYWPRYEQSTAFKWIPTVGSGWDGRQHYPDQLPDSDGPYPNGKRRLYWFVRTPGEYEQYFKDAITAATTHPQLDVAASPGEPPLIMADAWTEGIGEGHYLVPTVGTGYTYEQAIATALGLPFNTTHPRKFASTKITGTQLTGTLTVADHWSPCDVDTVVVQTASGAKVATVATKPGGSFTLKVAGPGSYKVTAAKSTKYQQTCAAVTSTSVVVH